MEYEHETEDEDNDIYIITGLDESGNTVLLLTNINDCKNGLPELPYETCYASYKWTPKCNKDNKPDFEWSAMKRIAFCKSLPRLCNVTEKHTSESYILKTQLELDVYHKRIKMITYEMINKWLEYTRNKKNQKNQYSKKLIIKYIYNFDESPFSEFYTQPIRIINEIIYK